MSGYGSSGVKELLLFLAGHAASGAVAGYLQARDFHGIHNISSPTCAV